MVGLALLASGCNGGLLAVLSEEEASDSAPSISGFAVQEADASPATVRFLLKDADGDDAQVSLFYQVPGGAKTLLTQLPGENPARFKGTRQGVLHELEWNYANELDLPDDSGFTPGVTVSAELKGSNSLVAGANVATLGLGNDAPRVDALDVPDAESTGIVPIEVTLSDSSSDEVAARVEFRFEGEDGFGEWQLARPAGESETPGVAIVGVAASPDGVSQTFFWDTEVDVAQGEGDVQLRVTALDTFVEGTPRSSSTFRVDNNEIPFVDLNDALVAVEATDRRGGVAIPFTVRDAESDRVDVLLQWSRLGESFPELPTDPAELRKLRSNPEASAAAQLCTPQAAYLSGLVDPVDPEHVRLPELGTSAVPAATDQLVGRTLEILRPRAVPIEVTEGWTEQSVSRPVAACPLGDGSEALVLDAPVSGTWRLLRVELATGKDRGVVSAGTGIPTALAVDATDRYAFVAQDLGANYRIERVEIDGVSSIKSVEAPYNDAGAVRGMAATGQGSIVFSVDGFLRRVSFSSDPAAITTILSGLPRPWGVAADPLDEDSVIVALHDVDRVVAVDLLARTYSDVAELAEGTLRFQSPRGVALDRGGSRVLVVTDDGAQRSLSALNYRSAHDLDEDGLADPFVAVLATLPAGTENLNVGANQLTLLPATEVDGMIALGGIEQRREITAASSAESLLTVAEEFDPPLDNGVRLWRIPRNASAYRGSPQGVQHIFAWDTSDLVIGGDVLLRAVPLDTDLGMDASTTSGRPLDAAFGMRRSVLDANVGGSLIFSNLTDYDRDGDLDVLVSDGAFSRVYLQVGPGRFGGDPVALGLPLKNSAGLPLLLTDLDFDGADELVHVRWDNRVEVYEGFIGGGFNPNPQSLAIPMPAGGTLYGSGSIAAADLEGDGDLDLFLALPVRDVSNERLFVYLQEPTGKFDPTAIRVGGAGNTDNPHALAVADLDGNGLADIVVTLDGGSDAGVVDSGRIAVFFQPALGEFAPGKILGTEDPIGGPGSFTTGNARAVTISDVDADGDYDIVAAHGASSAGAGDSSVPQFGNVFTIHLQESPKFFSAQPLVLSAGASGPDTAAMSVATGDIDGDGDIDVVGQTAEGLVAFYASSVGEFLPEPQRLDYDEPLVLPTSGDLLPAHSCELADIDGDGDVDVLYRNGSSGAIELRLQSSRGLETFSAEPLVLRGSSLDGIADVVLADLDGSGCLDLATANGAGSPANDALALITTLAPRSFQLPATEIDGGDAASTVGVRFIEAADLDGDGDRDLLTTNDDGELLYFPRKAKGFGAAQVLVDAGGARALIAAQPVDFDGDGDLDLLTFTDQSVELIGLEQTSPGDFNEVFRLEYTDGDGLTPRYATAADLDGDRDFELLVVVSSFNGLSQQASGALLIFDGIGQGQFETEPSFFDAGGSHDVQVADLDQDGDMDIATELHRGPLTPGEAPLVELVFLLRTAGAEYETIRVRVGDAPLPQSDSQRSGSRATRLLDVDADGDLDALSVAGRAPGGGSAGLVLVEQLAPGVFNAHPPLDGGAGGDGGTGGQALRVEDLDGDGELDLILTERSSVAGESELRVLWGND